MDLKDRRYWSSFVSDEKSSLEGWIYGFNGFVINVFINPGFIFTIVYLEAIRWWEGHVGERLHNSWCCRGIALFLSCCDSIYNAKKAHSLVVNKLRSVQVNDLSSNGDLFQGKSCTYDGFWQKNISQVVESFGQLL